MGACHCSKREVEQHPVLAREQSSGSKADPFTEVEELRKPAPSLQAAATAAGDAGLTASMLTHHCNELRVRFMLPDGHLEEITYKGAPPNFTRLNKVRNVLQIRNVQRCLHFIHGKVSNIDIGSATQRLQSIDIPELVAFQDHTFIIQEDELQVRDVAGFNLVPLLNGQTLQARRIGSGSFAKIFLATAIDNNKKYYAAKVESLQSSHNTVLYEGRLLQYLQGAPGFPVCYHCEEEGWEHAVLVTNLLGPNLEDLFNLQDRQFSLKTILIIFDQVLHRIEYLHAKQFIHRDIKPENFCIGIEGQEHVVHMIDFGMAKRYRRGLEHIPFSEQRNVHGTLPFSSRHAMRGHEQSRRDDFESMGHMLAYLVRGSLPWQAITFGSKEDRRQRVLEAKAALHPAELLEGHPRPFAELLHHARTLEFDESPAYAHWRTAFQKLYFEEGHEDDGELDWSSPGSTSRDASVTGNRGSMLRRAPSSFLWSQDDSDNEENEQ